MDWTTTYLVEVRLNGVVSDAKSSIYRSDAAPPSYNICSTSHIISTTVLHSFHICKKIAVFCNVYIRRSRQQYDWTLNCNLRLLDNLPSTVTNILYMVHVMFLDALQKIHNERNAASMPGLTSISVGPNSVRCLCSAHLYTKTDTQGWCWENRSGQLRTPDIVNATDFSSFRDLNCRKNGDTPFAPTSFLMRLLKKVQFPCEGKT